MNVNVNEDSLLCDSTGRNRATVYGKSLVTRMQEGEKTIEEK